jgi:pimeloyl-ACP methyl ester carboxylesterase
VRNRVIEISAVGGPRRPYVFALAGFVLLLLARPAFAVDPPGRYQGVLGESAYLISVPRDWNGGLVMFAHGYEGEGSGKGMARGEPLDDHLTKRGYAWAASGYRAWGYRPDWFLLDLLTLRAHFINRFGQPRWTLIHGQSMGGHISIASLELQPEVYQGALIECGVIDGVGLTDWLHAYTAAAQYFSGLPLLDTPYPEFDHLVYTKWLTAMGEPGYYTDRGRRFDSVVKYLAGGDLPFRREGLALRYLRDLHPRDPGPGYAREFARHADTRHIHYDIDPGLGINAATLNREIPRVVPEPGARSYATNPVFAELTGKIRVPVMAIHETGDFRVPFRLELDYRRRTEHAGTSHLLVQRALRQTGHCDIDGAVRERVLDNLVDWIENRRLPEGDDMLGDVTQLGLRWTLPRQPTGQAPR